MFKKLFHGSGSHFLAFLLFLLVFPSVAVVFVAVGGMLNQERAMEAAVSSYVQDLAESMSLHMSTDPNIWSTPMIQDVSRYPFFSWGPSIPGWVALINSGGNVIIASPGAMNIANIWRDDLPIGQAVMIEDKQGAQYTLAVYPLKSSNGYVIAAVSWNELLGGLVTVSRIWPILIVIITIGSFLAIKLLWSSLVVPLQMLVAEIDDMRLGKDLPNKPAYGAVKEIDSVHSALLRFSQAAVERDNLRNKYVRDIVQAQEKERMDMAREIHDGPLQEVTALVQQIHMTLDDEDEKNKTSRIKRTEIIAKSVVRELRALCDELAPPWMDLGLTEALMEMAERLSQVYDIQVSADFNEEARSLEIENEIILSLLRIVQEAVSNAVRHGEADEVGIKLRKKDNSLVLEISDNGKGFEADKINSDTLRLGGHRGLASMTERMALLNGKFEITSDTNGGGTKIKAVLNL